MFNHNSPASQTRAHTAHTSLSCMIRQTVTMVR